MKGVLICAELKDDNITSVSKELITTGKRLSEILGQPLDFLLVGKHAGGVSEKAAQLGVSRILTAQNPQYAEWHPEHLTGIITAVCRQIQPSIILMGQTDMGRDIAPRLATKLGADVCLDCVHLSFDAGKKRLIQTKPVYGGYALAQWASPLKRPQVVTMRPRSEKPAGPDPSGLAERLFLPVESDAAQVRSQLMETTFQKGEGINLEEARIVVAGGGGIGSREGFDLIHELADVLGAAVGTTRVPSDENWMPKNLEVGQTGHVVSPDLYIAVGISGAPQHMAGCSSSKVIVAINKDPQAPIFGMADFGIVGDYREVLPALIHRLKGQRE